MLTLGQEVVITNFAKELIRLIRLAIETKPINRVSRRMKNGKVELKRFQSPVNASGNLAKTLRYEITDTRLSIYANDYIYDLVWGKPPSTTASSIDHNLEGKIRKWIDDKGLGQAQEIEILGQKVTLAADKDTMAALITNKIQKHGSSIYLAYQGKNSGLLENIINDNLIKDYNSKFTRQLSEDFKAAFENGN